MLFNFIFNFSFISFLLADPRSAHQPRTVPYQGNCEGLNDPRVCDYFHVQPTRMALGQLAFVVPSPPPPPPTPSSSCSIEGVYYDQGDTAKSDALTIARVSNASGPCVLVVTPRDNNQKKKKKAGKGKRRKENI